MMPWSIRVDQGLFRESSARYVRELEIVPLERVIARMTSVAANDLKLYDRGRIAPGAAADLVVFDADRVRDRSTFAEPNSAGGRNHPCPGQRPVRDRAGQNHGRIARQGLAAAGIRRHARSESGRLHLACRPEVTVKAGMLMNRSAIFAERSRGERARIAGRSVRSRAADLIYFRKGGEAQIAGQDRGQPRLAVDARRPGRARPRQRAQARSGFLARGRMARAPSPGAGSRISTRGSRPRGGRSKTA